MNSVCVLWQGAKDRFGYGQIHRNHKTQLVHRYLFAQKYGSIPNGCIVMHSCDNPSCINLDHLNLGTVKMNALDMVKKERGHRKLSWEKVRKIRERVGTGELLKFIAKDFNIGVTQVYRIASGYSWSE